ncbi:MAG: hypothetical protein ACREMZ_12085 [Gemmatimonadales bacterium]
MRAFPLSLLLSLAAVSVVQAQMDYYVRLGVTAATNLMRDHVVEEIEVRQGLAPTLALGAAFPIAPLYRAGLEATLTTSGHRSTQGGTETDLGTIRTGSMILGLDGPIGLNFRWRAGAGLISYWPSEERGIFLRGGTTRFLAGAGLDYRRPAMESWELMVSLRYDVHRFTTDELQARGFSQSQGVQRIAATIGLARGN